jgi:3-isopropylmalate/(R)-2-methylmalate dehydratase large subunit
LLIECDGIQDVCEEGDTVTVEVNKCVRVNGHEFPVKPVPDNLFRIVSNGGLIEDTKKRITEDEKLHIRQKGFTGNIKKNHELGLTRKEISEKKGYTLAEKLLMKNSGIKHVVPGDIVITRPDMFMIHDIYTPYLVDTINKIGAQQIEDPEKVTIVFDHCMPTAVAKNDSAHYDAGLELSRRFGVRKLHVGEGICHSLMHEKRYGRPGEIATATDSHTTTYGGAGCFCTGIGTAEMAAAIITGELCLGFRRQSELYSTGNSRRAFTQKMLF